MSEVIKILSWNYEGKTNKYKLGALRELVTENKIDIVVLQEASGIKIHSILSTTHTEVIYDKISNGGVRIFLKNGTFIPRNPARLGYYNKYALLNLRHVKCSESFNIVGVHLYSKVGRTDRKQMWENLPFINEINIWENSSGSENSILIGDFNHNPFDSNINDPNVINSRDSRAFIKHQMNYKPIGVQDKYWYNPMWNLLGDNDPFLNTPRVTGTYYLNKRDETQVWNMIDGFMLRPGLMNSIHYKDSKVLTSTTNHKMVKSRTISEHESFIHEFYSDHLPILLTIEIN